MTLTAERSVTRNGRISGLSESGNGDPVRSSLQPFRWLFSLVRRPEFADGLLQEFGCALVGRAPASQVAALLARLPDYAPIRCALCFVVACPAVGALRKSLCLLVLALGKTGLCELLPQPGVARFDAKRAFKICSG